MSDPANPARVQNAQLAQGSNSTAEYDHHAFLYWPKTKLALVPVSIYDYPSGSAFSGAIGFTVDPKDGIDELGRIQHPVPSGWNVAPGIDRSVVVGNRVLTISTEGTASNDLNSLGAAGFVGFPQPPQVNYGGTEGSPPSSTPAQPPSQSQPPPR